MDASSSQENLVDPPRNLFFGVEDRRLGGRTGLPDKNLWPERDRRQKLAQHVIDSAIQVANAVRTLRTFDKTGNADQALGHLECSLDDLCKQTRNLIAEVEKSVDRYGDGLDALALRDEAAAALNAPAAAAPPTAAAGPTRIDGTPGPSPAVVAAQVQANLNRALDRIEVESKWAQQKVQAYR